MKQHKHFSMLNFCRYLLETGPLPKFFCKLSQLFSSNTLGMGESSVVVEILLFAQKVYFILQGFQRTLNLEHGIEEIFC